MALFYHHLKKARHEVYNVELCWLNYRMSAFRRYTKKNMRVYRKWQRKYQKWLRKLEKKVL